MATIADEAKAYMPPQTLNIAELEFVPVDMDLDEETHTTMKDGKEEQFTIKVIVVEDKKYRVPTSVLKGLKGLLEKLPDTKYFCVSKSGSGMNTEYQVLPHQGFDKVKEEVVDTQ